MRLWEDYDELDRVAFLVTHLLKGGDPNKRYFYDHNLIAECESKLDAEQRDLYVRYMDSFIARLTYRDDMTEEEVRSDAIHTKFFWQYATAPVDIRSKILWHIIAKYAP